MLGFQALGLNSGLGLRCAILPAIVQCTNPPRITSLQPDLLANLLDLAQAHANPKVPTA